MYKASFVDAAADYWALSSVAYQRQDDTLYTKVRGGIYKGSNNSKATYADSNAAFDVNSELDYSRYYDTANPTSSNWKWVGNFVRASGKMSVTDFSGTYVSGWAAGSSPFEDARLFNVNISIKTNPNTGKSGPLGTAFFGFGAPISDANFNGFADHFYCNWTNRMTADMSINNNLSSNTQRGYISAVQRQSFYYNQSTAVWQIAKLPNDSTKEDNFIEFAPSTTCGDTGLVDKVGGNYKYQKDTSDAAPPFVNSVKTHSLKTKDAGFGGLTDYVKSVLGVTSVPI